MKRRRFLESVGATLGMTLAARLGAGCGDAARPPGAPACGGGTPFEGGEEGVAHVLATVGDRRMLLKVSLVEPGSEAPVLSLDGCSVAGTATTSDGGFWAFDAGGLEPGRTYRVELRRGGRHLTEPWPLATFPARDARPERFRLLAYGCAGGHPIWDGIYHPLEVRRRLLRRALALGPDAAMVSGDHVYWDLRSGPWGSAPAAIEHAGAIDRTQPVLGADNEDVLKRAVGPQIAGLYGTLFRSLPVFFVRDDHDYFEDDRSSAELTTFPADRFSLELARATQWLYYPELLPDPSRPADLPASAAPDRPPGVGEAFGTLRFGRLFEGLLYDCKGFVSLAGDAGTIVPAAVEEWLLARTRDAEVDHVVHLPSNPIGYSAGKFGEWYPDVVVDGELTTDVAKAGWQSGWLAQHDRIVAAASARGTLPLFLASDLHGQAELRITRSGQHDLRANPVVAVVVGTPGTRTLWPSVARGTVARPPGHLDDEEPMPMAEVNGFHLVDFTRESVTVRHYRWSEEDGLDAIDTLEPFRTSEYPRRA